MAQEPGPAGVTVTLSARVAVCARASDRGATVADQATASRAGIRRIGWGYGQTALVTAIRHDFDHEGVASQVFMPSAPWPSCP